MHSLSILYVQSPAHILRHTYSKLFLLINPLPYILISEVHLISPRLQYALEYARQTVLSGLKVAKQPLEHQHSLFNLEIK